MIANSGSIFARMAVTSGINVLRTPYLIPQPNAVWTLSGSVRRECLDHFLILYEKQLSRLLMSYARYFNQARPHRGLRQRIPDPPEHDAPSLNQPDQVILEPMVGGLHHDYLRAA